MSEPVPHPRPEENRRFSAASHPLGIALLTTVLVTALAYVLPEAHQATGVGLTFLAATYFLVLRHDAQTVRRHGLALGGLFEAEASETEPSKAKPLSARRLIDDGASALAWAFALALLVFPLFWLGWVAWWQPKADFSPASPGPVLEDMLGQIFVIALPEEAFYRGYLQSALDEVWRPRLRILGASLGPSVVVTSALFALGHLATELDPNRLAVFFPALLFGWLRARTGGIGAALFFHALCNLFASYLARSYGF